VVSAEAQRVAYHSARLGDQGTRPRQSANKEMRQLGDHAVTEVRLTGVPRPEDDVSQCHDRPVRHTRRSDQDELDHGQVVVLHGGEEWFQLEVWVLVAVCPAAECWRLDMVDG